MQEIPAISPSVQRTLKPLGLQLYTLRDVIDNNFPAALERVAALGYAGVEPAGFHELSPRQFRAVVDNLGMAVTSMFNTVPLPEHIASAIDSAGECGATTVVCGFGPKDFADAGAIRRTADLCARLHAEFSQAGLTLALHNHAWEFEILDGRPKLELFADLCPDISFEIDVFWAANHGDYDPVRAVRTFAARTPLIHIKDGPLTRPKPGSNTPMSPAGAGEINIPAIIEAIDPSATKWLIVEQDFCDPDPFTCIAQSCRYMLDNGFARGR